MIFLASSDVILVPDGTLLFNIALILVMVFVLNRTLFKPINRILEERDRKIKGQGGGAASDLLAQVDSKLAHYENSLRAARTEGYGMLEEQRRLAMEKRQAQLELVRAEARQYLSTQKSEMLVEVEAARATLSNDARLMAAQIGSAILERPVS
jgi:F-type H+-transporting ATPase subunit b